MSKLSLHVQSFEGWIPGFVSTSGCKYIKVIDPPLQNPYPGAKVIGRTFIPDGDSNNMVWGGASGAIIWFNRWQGYYAERPWVHA